jgi:hypothetical protein
VSIVDELARECLGGLVARSITSDALIAELDRLAVGRSYPAALRCVKWPGAGLRGVQQGARHTCLREGVEARREFAAQSGRRERCRGSRL